MIPHDSSNDSGPFKDLFREVQLGDALGNDVHLLENLPQIDGAIREDAPQAGHWLVDKLYMAKAFLPAAGRSAMAVFNAIEAGVRRFTDIETRKTLAEAEAHKIRREADADYDLKQAEVRRKDVETVIRLSQGTAVADEVRASTGRKDELLQILKKKGIKLISEHDDAAEIVRVLFAKDSGSSQIESFDREGPQFKQ